MRILRLEHGGLPYYARWVDDATARLWTAAPWHGGAETDRLVPLRQERLLCPVEPSKIVCVGRNYRAHAAELGNEVPKEPLLFLKPPSALLGPAQRIELPAASERVEYEGEIVVVIGQLLRKANEAQALEGIYGYTCGNDVTARDIQRRETHFTRAKGFDTFCPVGPWIETDADPLFLSIETRVNNEVRQRSSTSNMVFPIATLLSFISQGMTLCPGDLVFTGTPEGVGPLTTGDRVAVDVAGVGALENCV